ncbi:MAG: hypothetical protein OXH59_08360 [Rhodospirillaceae bacterium]|nr:hypothetical protein [Rhodospirillaceae bacterium]
MPVGDVLGSAVDAAYQGAVSGTGSPTFSASIRLPAELLWPRRLQKKNK